MVDFASLPIPVVPYAPVYRPGVGMAMTSLGELREKARLDFATASHRLAYHQIMLVTEGAGTSPSTPRPTRAAPAPCCGSDPTR